MIYNTHPLHYTAALDSGSEASVHDSESILSKCIDDAKNSFGAEWTDPVDVG